MCWNSLTTWHSREGKTDPSGLMGGLNLGQGEAGNWEPPEKVCSCWNTSYLACCQGYSGRELLQSWTVHMTGLFFLSHMKGHWFRMKKFSKIFSAIILRIWTLLQLTHAFQNSECCNIWQVSRLDWVWSINWDEFSSFHRNMFLIKC